MQDLHNIIKVVPAVIPQVQTNSSAAIVGEIVDTAGYDSVELVIVTGTLTDADATFAVTVEKGDDAALADTASAAADLIGSGNFTFADDKACKKVGYLPKSTVRKRYLRATITPTGNDAGAAPVAAVWVLSSARTQPVS
jgi:hypothetical protein